MEVKIYTDGAARGNPNGPGGYGVVLLYVDGKGITHRRELSGGYAKTTNNRMELMAAIVGLEALIRPCDVELYSDSQYLVRAFNDGWIRNWIQKGWKREKNKDRDGNRISACKYCGFQSICGFDPSIRGCSYEDV